MLRSIGAFTVAALLVALAMSPDAIQSPARVEAREQPAHKPADFKAAGQFVCAWKPKTGEQALGKIKELGLKVVLVSEEGSFVICEWKDNESLAALQKDEWLRYVEPDYPVYPTREEPKQPDKKSPVDETTLATYQKAGSAVCVWEPKKGKDLAEAVKQAGFKIDLYSEEGGFLICKWEKKLTKEMLEALSDMPTLKYVEPDVEIKLDPTAAPSNPLIQAPKQGSSVCRPNDPKYGELYGMENIRASSAWCCVQTSPVLVAIVDSGIDLKHEDLLSNIRTDVSFDFIKTDASGKPTQSPQDGFGHGTHVAGTIGAVGNNNVAVTGVCWRVQMAAMRVFDDQGKGGSNARVAAAILKAVAVKAKVVNLSLSGRGDSKVLKEAVDAAEKEGVLLVCAAGNLTPEDKELDNDKVPEFPANYPNANVISVAAIDKNNKLAGFSHFGKKTVHLAAPGVDILSTWIPNTTRLDSGTSMATPHVAGAAALIYGHPKFEKADFKEVKNQLLSNARKTPGLEDKCATGGTLDIGFLCPQSNPPPPGVTPPPVYIYYPPPCQCPQHPFRIFRRCR